MQLILNLFEIMYLKIQCIYSTFDLIFLFVFHTRLWSNYSLPLNAAINIDEKPSEIIQLRHALKVSEVNNKELHEQIERHVAKNHQLE